MRMQTTNNIWLKVLSLMLAIITWFYVADTLSKNAEEKNRISSLMHYNLVVKDLPVKPNIQGKVPDGYRIEKNAIKIEPQSSLISLPKELFEYIEFLKTEPIDVSSRTKTFSVNAGLEGLFNLKVHSDKIFKVIIPIQKEEPGK